MTRWQKAAAVAVVMLVGGALGSVLAMVVSDAETAGQVREQREIVDEIDETAAGIACLVKEMGRTFVTGVELLLADREDPGLPTLQEQLRARLAALEATVEGVCPEAQP